MYGSLEDCYLALFFKTARRAGSMELSQDALVGRVRDSASVESLHLYGEQWQQLMIGKDWCRAMPFLFVLRQPDAYSFLRYRGTSAKHKGALNREPKDPNLIHFIWVSIGGI